MKGERQLLAIAHGSDMAVCLGKHFDAWADRFDVRRADEILAHRADVADFGLRDETAELAAVGVAAHGDGQRLEARALVIAQMLCQEDEAGACRQDGHALLDPGLDGCEHSFFKLIKHIKLTEQLALHSALATRQHEAIRLLSEVGCAAQLAALRADRAEHRFVFGKGALHGEHADSLCHIISPVLPSRAQSPPR